MHLEVCRGYPLPFDPDDPNNEIVITMAVSSCNHGNGPNGFCGCLNGENAESSARSAKSMPDLSARPSFLSQRHSSADLLSTNSGDHNSSTHDLNHQMSSKADYLSVEIVKGKAGFGFTIADSVYGQKVFQFYMWYTLYNLIINFNKYATNYVFPPTSLSLCQILIYTSLCWLSTNFSMNNYY